MGQGYRHQPDDYEALAAIVRDLQRQINALRGGARVENSVISGSGKGLIVNGGDVKLLNTDGTVLLSVGGQTYGDRGVSFYRDDGSVVFSVKRPFSALDPRQSAIFYDPRGRVIGGDSQLSPWGFGSPHIPLPFRAVDNTDAKTTASGSFTALFEHKGPHNNPACLFTVQVTHSNGAMTSEWQVYDVAAGAGLPTYLGSPWVGTVPAGTTAPTLFASPSPLGMPDPTSSEDMQLQVRARVASGAGTVTVSLIRAIGSDY